MKINEKMMALMREATRLLPHGARNPAASAPTAAELQAATSALQRKLQEGLKAFSPANHPANQPGNQPADNLRDINPPPVRVNDKQANTPADKQDRQHADPDSFVSKLLSGLGLPAQTDWSTFEGPKFDGATWAPQPHAEPAIDPAAPGRFIAGSHTNAAGTRSYKLYIPTAYTGEAGQSLPLVVMLHGCTQNPDDFAAGTKMNALAEATPCLVVYPAQVQSANSSKCWNWFNAVDQKRDQGEPSIIAGITRDVIDTYHVDQRQVYIAGLSAGGAMAAIMGATYPDLYAAVGIHSGLPYASAHDLPSALAAMKSGMAGSAGGAQNSARLKGIPIIVFHGDKDQTVHPRNGVQVMAQSLAHADTGAGKSAASARSRAKVQRGQVPDGHAYTRTIHHDEDDVAVGEHWLVHGAAHAWSGGSQRGSYTDGKGPDATHEMMRFFSTQSSREK